MSFPSPQDLPDPGSELMYPAFPADGASLVAQRFKHLPGMLETWVQSLSQEDPLEKEMATHFSILAWRIPWREEPCRLQSMGPQKVGHDWGTSLSLSPGNTNNSEKLSASKSYFYLR